MRYFILFILSIGVSEQMHAQYFDKTYSLTWDINKLTSNTDYADNLSARGFRFGYREMISEKVFGGIDFNNTSFTGYLPRRTYYSGSNAITTDLFNYIYSYGLTLSFDYLFDKERKLIPFAGLGIGASYLKYRQYYNVYTNGNESWGVLVRPQAGVLYRIKENASWALQGAVHYDYSSAKSDELGLEAFGSIGLNVGIIILDW